MGNQQQGNSPLHLACASGDTKSVEHILTKDDCDINCQNDENSTPLHLACYEGHTDIVKLLLAKKECNINCQDKDGDTPLHLTCYSKGDSSEIVKLLIEKGCDPNCRNKKQRTALHIAAHKGNVKLICTLMAKGKFDLNIADEDGNIPLHYACFNGSQDAVKEFLKCNINSTNKDGNTPLHIACMGSAMTNVSDPFLQFLASEHGSGIESSGFISIAKLLLEQPDCDSNHQNREGATPLHIVCAGGQLEIFELLMGQGGCDINCRDGHDNTPLHLACHEGHSELIMILLRKEECIISAENEDGNTPLHMACKTKDDHSEIVRLLIEKGCDPNCRNKEQRTALHIAAHKRNVKLICTLMAKGRFDLSIADEYGNIPLHYACFSGSQDAVKELLKCNINSTNKDGNTPLHIACMGSAMTNVSDPFLQFLASEHGSGIESSGFIGIAKLLLEQPDCDSNHQNREGATPLHIVCAGGQLEIFKLLIERSGCDINCRDGHDNTALHLACHEGHSEVIQLLLRKEECDKRCLNEDGNTPLHMACKTKGDRTAIVTLLIENGCDQNSKNKKCRTPLHIAARKGNMKLINVLLAKETCELNIPDIEGNIPLHHACYSGSLDAAKELLECNINAINKDGNTPLHIACMGGAMTKMSDPFLQFLASKQGLDRDRSGFNNTAKLLLEQSECESNGQNIVGATPLHIVCAGGQLEIFKFLMGRSGCDINCRDVMGNSPLHLACHGGHNEIVKILVSKDECQLSCQDKDGDTPLHMACYSNSIEVIRLLINKGCDPKCQNNRKRTPLQIASHQRNGEMMAALLQEVCTPDQHRLHKSTPLHRACRRGNILSVKNCLSKANCDINCTDENGNTPLHIACFTAKINLVELLLKSPQCDPNIKNTEGMAPIHIASMKSKTDITRLLLNKKGIPCDPNLRAGNGRTALHAACFCGDLDTVRILLSCKNCDVNCQDMEGATPLHYASSGKSLKHAQGILSFGTPSDTSYIEITKAILAVEKCDPNSKLLDGSTPLHVACKTGFVESAKLLIERSGCNPNSTDEDGNTPLHIACYKNNSDVAELLLKCPKCDPNIKNTKGMAPIHIASTEGNTDIIKLLLCKKGIQCNLKAGKGRTALHAACFYRHLEVVKLLIDHEECDVNCRDEEGATPLHYASSTSVEVPLDTPCTEMVSTLLKKDNCNINLQDEQGNTPLHIVCYEGTTALVRLLAKESVISIPNEDGDTPLHMACKTKADHSEIVKQLIDKGCDPNCRNKKQRTPLHIAAHKGNVKLICSFLETKRCILNLPDKHGNIPLHHACSSGSLDAVKKLLSHGNCNTPNKEGNTPLHIACRAGAITDLSNSPFLQFLASKQGLDRDTSEFCSIAKLLLEETECKSNCQNREGATPLHIVCAGGQLEIFKLLIERSGCDINCRDGHDNTPLHLACHGGHIEIVQILLKKENCNLSYQNDDGDTALHMACKTKGDNSEIVRLLIDKGCDPNCKNKAQLTPLQCAFNMGNVKVTTVLHQGEEKNATNLLLHRACKDGLLERVEQLMSEVNCDPNCADKNGETPLHIACHRNNSDLVKIILTSPKCDPNIKNTKGVAPIHIASMEGNTDIIKLLLCKKGIQCNMKAGNGRTALHAACFFRHLEVVKLLLDHEECDVNCRDEEGATPLHYAFLRPAGHPLLDLPPDTVCIDMTKAILEREDNDPNCKLKKDGSTPLHLACRAGLVEIASILLSKNKVQPNLPDEDGDTPLHIACYRNKLDVVGVLLNNTDSCNPCNPDCKNTKKLTPIHIASMKGYADIVHLLIHGGCNVNEKDENDRTALHGACHCGHHDVIKELLSDDAQCDVNCKDKTGATPLHYVSSGECIGGHIETAKLLLEKNGCDPNCKDMEGNTPIHYACYSDEDVTQIIDMLLQSSTTCDPNIQDNNGMTPLHIACAKGFTDKILQLLSSESKDCKVSIKDKQGHTCLHIACQSGKLRIVKLFLGDLNPTVTELANKLLKLFKKKDKRNDDPYGLKVTDNSKATALHHACKGGNIEVVKELLEKSNHWDINCQTETGDTPLHIACDEGNADIAALLLAKSKCHVSPTREVEVVEIDTKNNRRYLKRSKTPLDIACETKNMAILRVLMDSKHHQLQKDQLGHAPLIAACQCGDLKLVKELLQRTSANVNKVIKGTTMLHEASANGYLKVVEHLVNTKHAQCDLSNDDGNHPIHLACANGHEHVIKFFLGENSPEVNQKNQNLLHIACAHGHVDIAMLMMKTFDLNAKDEDGNTPLHLACKATRKEVIMQLVSLSGCDINLKNKDDEKPLHISCRKLQLDSVCLLLNEARCEVDSLNAAGKTPLYEAVQAAVQVKKEEKMSQDDALSIISTLANDKRCHLQRESGETPLMVGASQPYSEYQLCILEAILHTRHFHDCTDCKPICDSKTGDTVLHVACKKGNLKLVQWLIDSEKFDLQCKNYNEDIPLHTACHHLQVKVVEFLLDNDTCELQLNSQNVHMCTPVHNLFHAEVWWNIAEKTKVANLLFAHPSINPSIQDEDENTVLHLLCKDQNLCTAENVTLLINSNKCQLNIQNKRGNTALHVLCSTEQKTLGLSNRKKVFQTLIRHPDVNPFIKNVDGNTPLHLMLHDKAWWDSDLLDPLVRHSGFNPNIQNEKGDTVLHVLSDDDHESSKDQDILPYLPVVDHHEHDSSQTNVFTLLMEHSNVDLSIKNVKGNTPLHLMLHDKAWWNPDLLAPLVRKSSFNPNIQNLAGDTVLHVLCDPQHESSHCDDMNRQRDVFNFLMQRPNVDPCIQNLHGNTPLHLMLQGGEWWDSNLICQVIEHKTFDPNVQNETGNTVMHVLCLNKQLTISKCKDIFHLLIPHPMFNPSTTECVDGTLIQHGNFDSNVCNQNKETLIHLLAQIFPEIGIELLWKHSDSYLYTQNKNGDTAMHILLRQLPASVEKEVVAKLCQIISKLNPAILKNNTGDTILHSACYCNIKQVVVHLSETFKEASDVTNSDGRTPLHIAATRGNSSLIQILVTEMQANALARDKKGNTPFHLAFLNGHPHVVRALISCGRVECNVQNKEGKTPLHIAAAKGYSSLIQPLIAEMQADPIAGDKRGNTPLHLACLHKHSQTVRALLSCGRVEFNRKNADNKTPMELGTTSEIKEMMSLYQDTVSRNMFQPFLKLFVIGDSGAGKSTLIQALCKDFPTVARLMPKAMRRVTKPEPCTPGIIPYTFTSTTLGDILLYDFAGQDEYYTSHSAVLHHSTSRSPPVFLLVVKITEAEEELKKGLKKWLKFIRQYSAKAMKETKVQKPPHLVIIASHVDSLSPRTDSGLKSKQNIIVDFVAKDVKERQYYNFSSTVVFLDCRDSVSTGIQELLVQLQECRKQCSRNDIKVDEGCRYLHAFLMERNTKAISIENLASVIINEGELLPSNPSSLFELASTLNETGQILLLKNAHQHEKSWIITDEFRKKLLCEINGSLPELGKEEDAEVPTEVLLRQRVGIISHTELCELFSTVLNRGIDIDLIMNLMRHLEFCHDINPEDFPLAEEECLEHAEKYYFFPHVVSKEKPDSSDWKLGTVKWGWYLECAEGSRLTSRFLHVLLQRLVKFPLNEKHEGKGLTIWRRGLRWTGNAIKTVVEVGKHNESVVVLASCWDDCKIECAQHFTALIKLILDIKDVTCCDSTEVKESLIVPHAVTYPVQITDTLLPLKYIAKCSLEGKGSKLIYGKKEERIDLARVIFDPYCGFNKSTLWKLFREVTSNETVRDNFLETIADLMCKTHISFEAVNAGEEVAIQVKQFDHSDSSECLKIVQKLTDNGKDIHTMKKLQRKLNECSILYPHLVTLVMTVDHHGECLYASMAIINILLHTLVFGVCEQNCFLVMISFIHVAPIS